MESLIRRTGMVAAAAFLLLGNANNAAEAGSQYVVVAAEPPAADYEPGLVLNVSDIIIIPAGTVVTLLGEDGSINSIPGPASIKVTEDAVETAGANVGEAREEKRSAISKISDLLSGEKENADTLGVARSFSTRPKPEGLDDPWVISLHSDGDGCVRDDEIRLGRKSSGETLSVAVVGDDQSAPADLTMPAGISTITLPETLELAKNELSVRTDQGNATIRLHRLPDAVNVQNPVELLGWMIGSGCRNQALAFTKQLVVESR